MRCSLFLAFAALLLMLPANAKEQKANAYLFNLDQADWGPCQLFVSEDGIKKVFVRQQLVMQAVKPSWKPIAFWHQGKQICDLGKDAKSRSPYDRPPIVLPKNVPVSRVKTRLKNLTVFKESFFFKPESHDETDTMDGTFMPSGNSKKASKMLVGIESMRFEQPTFSAGLILAAGHIFNVVPSHGIALENRWILSDGGRFGGWSLTDWKRVSVASADFTVPKNYKRCKNFNELVGNAINADLDDVARQLNLGEPLGE